MPTHVPKRVYTASALEGWFGNLSGEWERFFDDHELSIGRELYQSGAVSSIELQKSSAIVHGKFDGKDIYALVEWEGESPTVRSSSAERLSGRALSVAGLYEAEELIADSVSPLPPETEEDRQASAKTKLSGGLFADDKKKLTASSFAPKPISRIGGAAVGHTPLMQPSAAASRPILVKLLAQAGALVFDAYWKKPDDTLDPALKYYKTAAPQVTEHEREGLIRLTALARKSGFELEGKKHDYVLKDFARIPDVINKEMETWKKYFQIEMPVEVLALGRGVQTINVEVEARDDEGQLKFHWLFLLGQKELNKEQVKHLLQAGREMVLIPELGLVKLGEEQADVIADWQETILRGDGTLPKYMLFSLFRQDALPIRLSKNLEGWIRSLMEEGDPTAGLPEFLRDYQKKGVAWLGHMLGHECHPLLADEMGLGKTVQMLSLLQRWMNEAAYKKPVLVAAPASVVPVWAQEASKYFPQARVEILSHDNPARAQGKVLWLASYGQIKRQAEALEKVDFEYAILDEAQMIKNPHTKAAKACYALRAEHRLAMTGTPIENKPMDLWSIFRFLMPGLLGGSGRFEQMTAEANGKLIERLHQQVSPFILRRTKAEVAKELPEKIEAVLVAPMGETQRVQYARLVEQGIKRFGNDLRKASRERGLAFFTLLTRLRQASCDAGLLPWVTCAVEESGKINTMLERLEGIIAGGSKVVIFSQFVGFLKRIETAINARFPDTLRFELTGSTVDRQKPVSEFQKTEGSAIMLVSLRAGGTGITLHAADYLFLMDPWWNPAVEDQAIDRVHRIGQKKTVFVYRVVSEGTIEARIQQLKAQKKELFNNVVGTIRDNTHFALYFKSMSDLIELAPREDQEVEGE